MPRYMTKAEQAALQEFQDTLIASFQSASYHEIMNQ